MNSHIKQLSSALDDLAEAIIDSYSNDSTMVEKWGWSMPAVNRHDLAYISSNLASKLRSTDVNEVDEEFANKMDEASERIELFKDVTLPYMFNGNGSQASASYFILIDWIRLLIEPLFTWEALADRNALPQQLKRKLRAVQADLENIMPEKNEIELKINIINKATEAAENLPADLQSLKEAREKVDQFSSSSAELFGKIGTYQQDSEKVISDLKSKQDEADRIVEQCSEAYRVTTSVGLAAAFDQRASRLSSSMWVWVVGLLLSLGIGGWIGAHRVELLSDLIRTPNPVWGGIWIHLILSLLSISAPIWFAWLATKQINQRFRLSEDYAFKASVSKAYEGYRREAVKIDSDFEARLFSSALSRLEEAPLRLVEADPHGSPWHEFLSSPTIINALDRFPELKTDFISMARSKLNTLKENALPNDKSSDEEEGKAV